MLIPTPIRCWARFAWLTCVVCFLSVTLGAADESVLTLEQLHDAIRTAEGEAQTELKLLALTRFDVPAKTRFQLSGELIQQYEAADDPVLLGKAFGGHGTAMMHLGNLPGALAMLQRSEAYGLRCEAEDPAVFFKARCNRAACLTMMGDSTVAVDLIQAALDFARPYGDQLDVAFLYILLAIHAEKSGAIDLALKYLQTAFEGAVKKDNANLAAQAGTTLIGVLAVSSQHEEASDWVPEVESWVDRSTDPKVKISFAMHREDLRLVLGDPEEAVRNLKLIAIEATQMSDPQFTGNVHLSLSAAENAVKNFDGAIAAADKAIELLQAYPRSLLIAKQHRLEAMFGKGQAEEALAGTNEILEQDQESYPRWKAFLLRSQILRSLGRHDEAFEAMLRCREAEALRLNERSQEQANFMSAVFDSQQRSNELALAKEREFAAEARSNLNWTLAEQQKNDARFERSLRYTVSVAAGIALLVGLALIRSISNRKSAIAMATREHQLNVELNNRLAQQAAELKAEVATRRDLELAVERKHRDETIGKLTGGMAHDFNNLLTVIIQSVELTKLVGSPLSSDVNQLLDASLKAAESGASIVNQLLAYARQQPLVPKHITVNDWLGSSRSLFRQVVGKISHFDAQEATGGSTLCVDSARLTTAIINLLANARDAIDPNRGRIELRVSRLTLNLLNQADWPESPSGQYVLFTVHDNGKGMSPEQLRRACEPFYSTKSQSAGTGLGLSSVQGFVKQSGGI